VKQNWPDIPPEKLERARHLMNAAIRDFLVSGYQPFIEGLKQAKKQVFK
jgi:hypothetical protein